MTYTITVGAALAAVASFGAGQAAAQQPAGGTCESVTAAVARWSDDAACAQSADLTTNNEATTPADNSLPAVPPLAFTPRTDRQAVAPDAPERPVPARAVPGIQIAGSFADDSEARFVLRLPDDWNGRLVTGVPSSTRSEYGLDYAWSDFVLQQGYAYVASNKGTFNVRPTTPADPKACPLSAPGGTQSAVYVHPYLLDSQNSIGEWSRRTIQAARLARRAGRARYGREPARNYLVGVSAGGWTIRHLLETRTKQFSGGVDWEGVAFNRRHNLLRDFSVALQGWPRYRAAGLDEGAAAYREMRAYGFAPEMKVGPNRNNLASPVFGSWWETHANSYWHLFACMLQKEFDPSYTGDVAKYDFAARDRRHAVIRRNRDALTSGRLRRPLITVAGTMDNLTLMRTQMRGYRSAVERAGRARLHRLYEVQNGGHVDRFKQPTGGGFVDLELVMPHAWDAFGELVEWIEKRDAPPGGQCIPRGGRLSTHPTNEHCKELMSR